MKTALTLGLDVGRSQGLGGFGIRFNSDMSDPSNKVSQHSEAGYDYTSEDSTVVVVVFIPNTSQYIFRLCFPPFSLSSVHK